MKWLASLVNQCSVYQTTMLDESVGQSKKNRTKF